MKLRNIFYSETNPKIHNFWLYAGVLIVGFFYMFPSMTSSAKQIYWISVLVNIIVIYFDRRMLKVNSVVPPKYYGAVFIPIYWIQRDWKLGGMGFVVGMILMMLIQMAQLWYGESKAKNIDELACVITTDTLADQGLPGLTCVKVIRDRELSPNHWLGLATDSSGGLWDLEITYNPKTDNLSVFVHDGDV